MTEINIVGNRGFGFSLPLRSRGPQSVAGVIDIYKGSSSRLNLTTKLGLLALRAKDLRVRYASLLLLDKLVHGRPCFMQHVHGSVKKAVIDIGLNRAEKTKWYLTAMLPKTDMHVHIDGSVRIETVMDLAAKHNVDLAAVLQKAKDNPNKGFCLQDIPALPKNPTIDDIRRLSQIEKVEPDFLKMLFMGFDFAISVMQTKEGLERTAYELVFDSWKEGVMHLNAIFAPCLHRENRLSYDEIIESVIAGLERGRRKLGVTWELSLAIYRGVYTDEHPEHPMETSQAAKRWTDKYPQQIAIDVVGAEFQTRLDHYSREYELLKGSNVILRAHAGEAVGQAFNIETAWKWGIRRIGHGSHLFDLEEFGRPVIQEIIDSGMVFESAPISNLKCLCIGDGPANKLANHKLPKLIEAGAKITLCTDDRTVMMVDNISQMFAIEQALGIPIFLNRTVAGPTIRLLNNGFEAIADKTLSSQYSQEFYRHIAQINELMEVLAD